MLTDHINQLLEEVHFYFVTHFLLNKMKVQCRSLHKNRIFISTLQCCLDCGLFYHCYVISTCKFLSRLLEKSRFFLISFKRKI